MKEICSVCKQEKNIGFFTLSNSKNGSVCKKCYDASTNKNDLHKKYDVYYQN